jgi:hypothetical protein
MAGEERNIEVGGNYSLSETRYGNKIKQKASHSGIYFEPQEEEEEEWK